ncbi:UNVERIFIED_CONTAM: hypothetical protein Scaly_2337100 [Sesamum calycinum]|uniref:DUF7880 domain-containing protein n=1 Tax=Sesamum calycinum TaxID=2727403 RepID=A0AAW2LWZ4_9LAMI
MTTSAANVAGTANISTRFASFLPFSRASSFTVKPRRGSFCSGVRCASSPWSMRESRRSVSLSIVFLHFISLSKVMLANIEQLQLPLSFTLFPVLTRKKLDPLEAYIPAVILTELQIKELGQYLEVDQPKFADCRNLLRSGPASSLRVNIRAVAQYASDAGNGNFAFNEVDQSKIRVLLFSYFLKNCRALEELDSLLLRASRNDSGTSIESMKAKVATALGALNSVLQTVPEEVLNKGKAMANEYINPGNDLAPQDLDSDLKKLESIL